MNYNTLYYIYNWYCSKKWPREGNKIREIQFQIVYQSDLKKQKSDFFLQKQWKKEDWIL